MKSLISPAVRVSFGLLMVTLSILFVGDWLGLVPDADKMELEQRKKLSESLAIQFSSMAQSGDTRHIRTTLEAIVNRNADLQSAAFRSLEGDSAVVAGNHTDHWTLDENEKFSTQDQVVVPIYRGKERWGSVELRFTPTVSYWFSPVMNSSFGMLVAFMTVSGFFLYLVFLKRVMRELDPAKVVPERVHAAFNTLAEGVLILDEDGNIVLANSAFARNNAIKQAKLIGVHASDLNWSVYRSSAPVNPDKLPWTRVLQSGKVITGEKLTLHRGSDIERSYTVNCTPIQDEKDKIRGAITTFDDLTELEKRNEQLSETLTELKQTQTDVDLKNKELQYLATRDPLTNCLNRRSFNKQFTLAYERAVREKKDLVCMMIDIDHFKRVNDNYGHGVGDKVIKFVADVLRKQLRQDDLLGRYGGEEFCVVLESSTIDQAMAVAERMRANIRTGDPSLFTSSLHTTASFGLVSIHDEPDDREELINKADKALYLAKESGRNKVMVWEENLQPQSAVVSNIASRHFDSARGAANTPIDTQTAAAAEDRIRQLEKIAEEKAQLLDHYAAYDPLTDLPSRHLFMDRVEQALLRAGRENRIAAVLSLGLLDLRRVNDTLGHESAEELLKVTANRLTEVLRNSDSIALLSKDDVETTISRLNEGEFGVLLPAVRDRESIPWIVRRIFDALQEPLYIGDHNLTISSNIGIGVFPNDGADAGELIKHASISRYYAEQQPGANNVEYYSEDINRISREQLHLESHLSDAIDNEEFEIYFQPKIDLKTGEINGFESLLRWNHPVRGVLTPYEFIDIAERTRLINIIGDWVLRQSCLQLLAFEKACSRELTVAVNMSPVQFSQPDLVERILSIVHDTGMDPRRLELELTESCLMENMDSTLQALAHLQSHGINISIDDFGTGYSGLSYLRTLPVNILKIDRCFIADIGLNEHDTAIVAAVVSMARALDLTVVAEGVETPLQNDKLIELDCDEAQGYLFSQPLTSDDARQLLLSRGTMGHYSGSKTA